MEYLTITDTALNDIGYAEGFSLDLEDGLENNFVMKVPLSDFSLYEKGCYIYCEDHSEYGGRISSYTVQTASDTVSFAGHTWRGILAQKFISHNIEISAGTSLTAAIDILLEEVNLREIFSAVQNEQTLTSSTGFCLGGNALSELENMLSISGCRPSFIFDPITKKINIGAQLISDLIHDEYDSDKVDLEITINTMPVNHCMAILEDGTVRHRYLCQDGTQSSEKQEFRGSSELMSVISTSADDEAEIEVEMQSVIDESVAASQQCVVTVKKMSADIGDIIGGRENTSGIFVKSKIISKILKMTQSSFNITFETGA